MKTEDSCTFNHLMVDLETMGTKSNSAIISIGAVEFNIQTGETGREFYRNIFLQSCIETGLQVDAATIMWWMRQNDDARNSLIEIPSFSIQQALIDFKEFCNKDYQIWGNSARFDLGLLENAYDKISISIPWKFKQERCLRTLVSFNPEIKHSIEFEGTAHNALDDCYHQIKYCHLTWVSLGK